MSSRLYLHIGTHKTATTTTQHFFSKNRMALREQGIFYPSQDIIGAPNHYAHHRIAHAIAGRDKIMDIEGVKAFFAAVKEQVSKNEIVFLSAEPFYRHLLNAEGRSETAAYQAYIDLVREVTVDFDVTIMVMLRRQDLFAESLYSEHVLSTNFTGNITQFLQEKQSLFDYSARLNQWGSAFGSDNIILQPFERESLQIPIERFFIEWLGGSWSEDFSDVGRFNSGQNRAFVEYKRRLNFQRQGNNLNSLFRKWLSDASKHAFVEKLHERNNYYLLPPTRYALMESFQEGNRILAQRYLGRDHLFLRSLEKDVQNYEPCEDLTYDEFQIITRNLLRMIGLS